MKIDHSPSLPLYRPQEHQNSPQQLSYKQTTALSSSSAISIQTAEGDIVTFSQDLFLGRMTQYSHEQGPEGALSTFISASLSSENISLYVQGDLNQEELTDIKNLFNDLTSIAQDFFQGDGEIDMSQILGLTQHMESISSLDARFSATLFSQESLAQQYQAPITEGYADAFMAMKEEDHEKDILQQIMRSQWEQIQNMLNMPESEDDQSNQSVASVLPPDNQLQTTPPQTGEPAPLSDPQNVEKGNGDTKHNKPREESNSSEDLQKKSYGALAEDYRKHGIDHAQKLMERIQETMKEHPRLSPFSVPIADYAMNRAASEAQQQNDLSTPLKHLRNDFLEEYAKWLLS